VDYKQVYQAYLALGNFDFSSSPQTLANDQVQIVGNSTPGKYISDAVVTLEGYQKQDVLDLCRAGVVVHIRAKEENQVMLGFLKELPMVITPSWSGNSWLAAGLAEAAKTPDQPYQQTITYLRVRIIWNVNLKDNALGLTFESACAGK
jgi:hypothetical protein